MYRATLIPGDGIGPEVTDAAVRVVEAAGVDIQWETKNMGQIALEKYGNPLPEDTVRSIEENKIALKGPVATQIGGGFRSVNVSLRQQLNLYANIRPIKSLAGVKSKYENVDIVIFRENTEDVYVGFEHMVGTDAAECHKIITRHASERIASFAFNYAVKEKRKKVTSAHKANIMQLTDGLFLSSVRNIASKYPDIEYEEMEAGKLCMNLVMHPEEFDIIVLPNLYGDLISELCAGLVGGLGVVAGANIGPESAVYEATHGTAPDLIGKGIANPTACILCGAMMLKRLGEREASDRIYKSVLKVLKEGRYVTPDLGGTSSTNEMVKAIIGNL
ncbi:MAG: isocitrate/isopropylmalate dehydrogenase family protein [Gracilibacteraceae bacterium]|jgi:isocitrate dehydrogenase (NAD+)|nr:isocitrate/isopropylmalate dehydrogenase family protein [Gracilibacteraceae bacterium]